MKIGLSGIVLFLCAALYGCAQTTGPHVRPPGADTTPRTDALKAGA